MQENTPKDEVIETIEKPKKRGRRKDIDKEKDRHNRAKWVKFATPRKKLAVRIAAENPHLSHQDVLRRAGYTESTAKRSTAITKTQTWEELMEIYLPDKLLSQKHHEFLTSPKTIKRFQRGDLTETIEEVSAQATKALDMAYKLKGRYQDINVDKALIVNVSGTVAAKYALPEIERYTETPLQAPPQHDDKQDDTPLL